MRICVISDVHFKYNPKTKEDFTNQKMLLSFLEESCGKYDQMILAGDIFDLWYDWRYTIIKQYFPLLVRLDRLKEQGCKVVLISGNHDFWFGDFLPNTMGIEVYQEKYCITDFGKSILACHGDTHTVNDLRYQVFRRIIRFSLLKKMFGFLHPDIALGIGSRMSRSSRSRKEHPDIVSKKYNGLISFAKKQIEGGKYDIIVMGHCHKPQLLQIGTGFYANAGDWINHHSYIEICDGEVTLKYYTV